MSEDRYTVQLANKTVEYVIEQAPLTHVNTAYMLEQAPQKDIWCVMVYETKNGNRRSGIVASNSVGNRKHVELYMSQLRQMVKE